MFPETSSPLDLSFWMIGGSALEMIGGSALAIMGGSASRASKEVPQPNWKRP